MDDYQKQPKHFQHSPRQSHTPRKRFGQNFLIDKALIHQLVSIISPKDSQLFVEIGPGHGAITELLLPKVKQLIAVEIDRDLAAELAEKFKTFGDSAHFSIVNEDALKVDFGAMVENQINPETLKSKWRLVGNLPYNISTPLLFHVMQWSDEIEDMHFMLQKEVAERMAASPGSKIYGRLSVMVQYHCAVTSVLHVPNDAFYPRPKVASQVVRLIPHSEEFQREWAVEDVKLLDRVVTTAFSHRRKRLGNALKGFDYGGISLNESMIRTAGVDPDWRPEQVPLEGFCDIVKNLVSTQVPFRDIADK